LMQSRQSFRLSSAACAASFVPQYSTLHLFPLASSIQTFIDIPPVGFVLMWIAHVPPTQWYCRWAG
jgi:hypothetical protein